MVPRYLRAMPAGLDVVREIVDALNRGDVESMLARMDSDFEWRPLEDSPVARDYRGHDRVRGYVEDWLATFDDLRLELGEASAVGDHVVVEVAGSARGRASGVELYNRFCQVWTLRDRKAVRMREYPNRDEALAALR